MLKFPIPNAGLLARLTLSITYFIFLVLRNFISFGPLPVLGASQSARTAQESN